MKRFIGKGYFLTLLFLTAGTLATAQETETKMSNYLEISYGPRSVINFQTFNTVNSDGDMFDFKSLDNLGNFGIRFDHLLNPSFSLGIDFYYQQQRGSGIMTEYATGIQSSADYSVYRFKTQIRIAYHLPVTNPNLDVYLGGGAGMNNVTRKLLINGSTASRSEQPYNFNFPVSLRTFAGLRYSFTKHFGMNAEIGIGGPLFSGGFHVRF